jgi:hypothetical protein
LHGRLGIVDRAGLEAAACDCYGSERRPTPIIALAAFVYPRDRLRARDAGCDLFLALPCSPERLVQAVRHFTDTRGARRNLAKVERHLAATPWRADDESPKSRYSIGIRRRPRIVPAPLARADTAALPTTVVNDGTGKRAPATATLMSASSQLGTLIKPTYADGGRYAARSDHRASWKWRDDAADESLIRQSGRVGRSGQTDRDNRGRVD